MKRKVEGGHRREALKGLSAFDTRLVYDKTDVFSPFFKFDLRMFWLSD
jgi:hypothetical protein